MVLNYTCSRCGKEFHSRVGEQPKYKLLKFDESTAVGAYNRVQELCPDCLAKLELFMKGEEFKNG